jgi:hypothetical protein
MDPRIRKDDNGSDYFRNRGSIVNVAYPLKVMVLTRLSGCYAEETMS